MAFITTFIYIKNYIAAPCPTAYVLTLFSQYLRETYAGVTQSIFLYFFYMSFQYIFSIELVGFCDAINNKGVKWGVRY